MDKLQLEISNFFYSNGLFGTFNYIMSSEQAFLIPRNLFVPDLNKAKELALLRKGERTLIWFINVFEEAKKRSISDGITATYPSGLERKISTSQIKVLRSKVRNLSMEKISYYKSFKGVIEFDRGDSQRKSVVIGLAKIYGLFTASTPKILDFDSIIEDLAIYDLEISKQDLIAFLSLVLKRGYGNLYSIPYDLWEVFFGEGKVKAAKLAFERQGLIIMVCDAIIGFKSAQYKLSFLYDENLGNTDVEITSISTLVKISRLKFYKSRFSLNNKIVALKYLTELYVESSVNGGDNGKTNLTNRFLSSGVFSSFIDDLETMNKIVSESLYFVDDILLAKHLLRFFRKFNKTNFTRYSMFRSRKKGEIKNSVKLSEPLYDFDDDCKIPESVLDDL